MYAQFELLRCKIPFHGSRMIVGVRCPLLQCLGGGQTLLSEVPPVDVLHCAAVSRQAHAAVGEALDWETRDLP